MENDDEDILNVEFDPTELEDIDEDALLLDAIGTSDTGRKSAPTPKSKPSTHKLEICRKSQTKNDRVQMVFPSVSDSPTKSLHSDVQSPSVSHGEQDSIDESKSAGSFDDDEDQIIGEKDRSKFHSERSEAAAHRPITKRTGIPDSLDNVKISARDAAFARSPPKRRRDNGFPPSRFGSPPKKILLNPHFQGTVPIGPQMRLAWDVRAQQPLQMETIRIRPNRPIPPSIIRQPPPAHGPIRMPNQMPPVQIGSMSQGMGQAPPVLNIRSPMPTPPRMPPLPVSSNAYRYPPPPPHSGMWTPTGPPPVYTTRPMMNIPPPTNAPAIYGPVPARIPPPLASSAVLRPVANFSAPPPSVQIPVLKPSASVMRLPKPASSQSSNDWLNMTEDFLRRTRMAPPAQQRLSVSADHFSSPKSNVSRQRQAAADVKRKYRTQDKQKKPSLSTRGSVDGDSGESTPVSMQGGKGSVEGVDADYMKKMEEQKRLRELMIKRKEQRRTQLAKTRLVHNQPTTESAPPTKPNGVTAAAATSSRLVTIKRAEISIAQPVKQQQFVGLRREVVRK